MSGGYELYPGATEEGEFLKSIAERDYLDILPRALGDNHNESVYENNGHSYTPEFVEQQPEYLNENAKPPKTRKALSSKRTTTKHK